MKNTQEFRQALQNGDLEKAESFLDKVAFNPDQFPNYDARWLDHRQRELFQAFCQSRDWPGAKRVVEATQEEQSQKGRRERLEKLSGLKYEDI